MVAALQALAVVLFVVGASTVVGRAVLAWFGPGRSLATATVVGAAALVLWLTWVALVVPPGSWAGVASLAVAAGALLAVTGRRHRGDLLPDRAELRSFGGTVLAGLAGAAPFLLIMARASSTAVVHLSGNHDAFFFTGVPQWLLGHRSVGGPGLSAAGSPGGTPLLGSVWDHYQAGSLRVGAESLTAALARLTGSDPLALWLPVTVAFHVVLVLGAQQAAARLWRPGWGATLVAAATGTSALVLGGIVDQHTPTVLALAFALGLVVELDRAGDAETWSPLLVALLLGGIAATYGEVLALLAVPVVAVVAWRLVRDRGAGLQRWLLVGAWSALALPAWWRTVRGAARSEPPPGYPSAFAQARGAFPALRSLALGPGQRPVPWAQASTGSKLLVVGFALALLVGVVAVVLRGRARPWWAALAGTAVVGWWWLGRSSSGYSQERFVDWAAPLLVLGALLGWVALSERVAGEARLPRLAGPAVLAVGALVLAVPGVVAATRIDDDPGRRIGGDFAATRAWVAEHDPTGAGTVVFAQDYVANLWVPYELRDAGRASYLTVYEDYYDVSSFGPVGDRRWLLLDAPAAAGATLTDGSVVERNARFTLVDLRVGPATVVVPPSFQGRWSAGGEPVTVTLTGATATCRTTSATLTCR